MMVIQVPLSAILFVLAIGSVSMLLFMRLPTVRGGLTVILKNKGFSFPLIVLFALFFWPSDPGQTFSAGSEVGVQRMFKVFVVVSLFVFFLFRLVSTLRWPRGGASNWYVLYVLVCGFSVLYAPDWREALWRSFELVVAIMFAAIVSVEIRAGRLSLGDILSFYKLILFVMIVFSFVGWLTYPVYAYEQWAFSESETVTRSLGGIVPRIAPNSLGQYAAMILFAGIAAWVVSGRITVENFIFMAFGATVLFLAHARTSIAALFFLVIVLLITTNRAAGKLVLVPLGLLGIMASGIFIDFYLRGQDTEVFLSLSGRTYMWEIAWVSILNNPWLGIGLAGHKSLDISLGMEFSTLDSTYVEALVNVGLIGAFFLCAYVVRVLWVTWFMFLRAQRGDSMNSLLISTAFGFLFIIFIRSLAGPSLQTIHWNLLMFLILADALFIARERKIIFDNSTQESRGLR